MSNAEEALKLHKKFKGKIGIALKDTVESAEKLSLYYTPGVGAVSSHVANHPEQTRDYTNTNNSVAIVSDGSAVLGLGDLGPEGALPVMEGKSMLFKSFANIDAFPLVLDVHSVDEIVATVAAIAPSVGGINLEDIKAPECFEVEDRLKQQLDIPVFHDDQHGTAIVTLAGLINAAKVVGKPISDMKIVVSGAGAAGMAIVKLLHEYAQPRMVVVDSTGAIGEHRGDLSDSKQELLKYSNQAGLNGSLVEVLAEGADVFIGVSKGGILTRDMVESMDSNPIVFAMANPDPEILPKDALAAGAAVMATGRSDFPNQINNALAFPGIFRGALDNNVRAITEVHKQAAAEAIAGLIGQPTAERIIPDVFDERLVPAIAEVIC